MALVSRMKQELKYSLKVWLTSSVIAPIICVIIGLVKDGYMPKGLHPITELFMLPLLYIFIAVCTCVVSLPTFLIFFFVVVSIRKVQLGNSYQTLLLLLVSQLLVVITFVAFLSLFPGFNANSYYLMMACHCLVIGVSVRFYKLNESPTTYKQ